MELKDLFLTPIYLLVFYGLAFAIRPRVTNPLTKRYFIPALTVKFIGAISLGLIFYFYYGGGDTFNYAYHASVISDAFSHSFAAGWALLTSTEHSPLVSPYTIRMFWFGDTPEYYVVRITAFIGLLCFNSYMVTALFFAILSFTGIWAMYITFIRIYPKAYKELAIAVFFLPSVFFWGSGLLKDSLCMGALGLVFYGFYHGFIEKRYLLRSIILGAIGAYILIQIKVYILMSFMAPALLWIFNENNQRIRNAFLRNILKPVFLAVGVAAGALGATQLTEGDERFDVENIGERTRITQTALYNRTKDEGSGYSIGTIDGSIGSIISVAPQAVAVSLYRPFLWEVRNPVMLLSALEALWFTILTARILFRVGPLRSLRLITGQPVVLLCLLFTIIFGIGVGTNSGNFGTLVRYKIPLMPFYAAALYILQMETLTLKRSKRSARSKGMQRPRLSMSSGA